MSQLTMEKKNRFTLSITTCVPLSLFSNHFFLVSKANFRIMEAPCSCRSSVSSVFSCDSRPMYDSGVHISKMKRSSVADGRQEYAENTLHVDEIVRDCLSFLRLLL